LANVEIPVKSRGATFEILNNCHWPLPKRRGANTRCALIDVNKLFLLN